MSSQHTRPRYLRRLAVLAIAVVPFGGGTARAGDGDQLGDVPALSEYIEDVPTATGSKSTTAPRPRQTRSSAPAPRLTPAAERALAEQPPDVRRALRKVSTSARIGAPKKISAPQLRSEPDSAKPPATEAFGTVFTVAATGGDVHLTVLLIMILLVTAVAVGVAARRTSDRR